MAFLISLARRMLTPSAAQPPAHHEPFQPPARPASPTSASWILHSR